MCNKVINGNLLQSPRIQDTHKLFDSLPLPKEVIHIYKMAMQVFEADATLSQFNDCLETTDPNYCLAGTEEYLNYFLQKDITNEGRTSKFFIADVVDLQEEFSRHPEDELDPETLNLGEPEYHFGNQFSLACKEIEPNRLAWEVEFLRRVDFTDERYIRYTAKLEADASGNLSTCSEEIKTKKKPETADDCNFPLIEQFVKMQGPEETLKTEEEAPKKPPSTDETPTPVDSSHSASKKIVLGALGAACAVYIAAKKIFSQKKP